MTMELNSPTSCTAFAGTRRLASGPLAEVVRAARDAFYRDGSASVLVFDDGTADLIDLDFSLTAAELVERVTRAARVAEGAATGDDPSPATPRGPGRPRLGVVAREVTLLPRHWEWLNDQPGGASVALRKLVEQARKANEGKDRQRRAQEVAYRFMSAMAGNLPGYEEALRALFAADRARFGEHVAAWPPDVRDYAVTLAALAFA
jgi:uncharacterized protein